MSLRNEGFANTGRYWTYKRKNERINCWHISNYIKLKRVIEAFIIIVLLLSVSPSIRKTDAVINFQTCSIVLPEAEDKINYFNISEK